MRLDINTKKGTPVAGLGGGKFLRLLRNEFKGILNEASTECDGQKNVTGLDMFISAVNGTVCDFQQILEKSGGQGIRDGNSADSSGLTALHHAARTHDRLEILAALLRKGANIDATDKDGKTPLMHAVEANNEQGVLFLLNNNANINLSDNTGLTALSIALKSSATSIYLADILRSFGAKFGPFCSKFPEDINAHLPSGWTLLHNAAQIYNNIDAVKELLMCGADPMKESSCCGKAVALHEAAYLTTPELVEEFILRGTDPDIRKSDILDSGPIHLAFYSRRNKPLLKVLEILLAFGVSVNSRDKVDSGPIHLAFYSRRNKPLLKVLEILLEFGVSVNSRDKVGDTPLSYARRFGKGEEIARNATGYKHQERNSSNMFISAVNGTVCDFQQILEKSGGQGIRDGNSADSSGLTALHHAARTHDRLEILAALLRKGANIDATDKDGKTPLMHAVEANNEQGVLFLLNNNANINLSDNTGLTALSIALKSSATSIYLADILRSFGAKFGPFCSKFPEDINAHLPSGWTLLHNAAQIYNNIDAVKELLMCGADPMKESSCCGKAVALHEAAYLTTPELVEEFILRGTDPDIRKSDILDSGPIHLAFYSRRNKPLLKVLEILLEFGVSVNSRDKVGDTPLSYARRFGKGEEIVNFLTANGAHE
ncbi:unnamed protein product [Notodromas monacha]|uniref:Uncharacterized protein n=1 Tax=Notodromas monacha TaxID=399045 RepID=A0A7R9GCC3_9CRUS|nr:unnamed protein product [Notodromas monacha]CAG0917510.1 unnamed protein product [Notodromas monacha]